jgi:hypothetical protein
MVWIYQLLIHKNQDLEISKNIVLPMSCPQSHYWILGWRSWGQGWCVQMCAIPDNMKISTSCLSLQALSSKGLVRIPFISNLQFLRATCVYTSPVNPHGVRLKQKYQWRKELILAH